MKYRMSCDKEDDVSYSYSYLICGPTAETDQANNQATFRCLKPSEGWLEFVAQITAIFMDGVRVSPSENISAVSR